MFSEYASRFLAQSQSRISNFVQPTDNAEASHGTPYDKYRRIGQPLRNLSRVYLSRHGNPYQSTSHLSNFNLTSRYSAAPDAPLFHSAQDEFRDDDEAERERETADFFALQKSRRVFASARLEDSSEVDLEVSNETLDNSRNDETRVLEDRGNRFDIKSSWTSPDHIKRKKETSPISVSEEHEFDQQMKKQSSSSASEVEKDRMDDIRLGSTIESDGPPEDLQVDMSTSESPPAFQKFCPVPGHEDIKLPAFGHRQSSPVGYSRSMNFTNSMPPIVSIITGETPMYDVFWGSIFLISLGGMFATFFLVFLHTETPNKTLGDTIYTTLHASFYLLAVDTVVSIIVSLIWLALLRSFIRPLVYLILIAVPIVLLSFSLHPFIASFKSTGSDNNASDQAMRWLSLVPGVCSLVWIYTIYRGRYSLNKAVGILEFASRILSANPGLLFLGFAILGIVACWTWIWLGMFTRVFLGGQISSSLARFIIDTSSWWLGVYFILIYIWTLSIISGIQRSTAAATVSEWYFYRNIKPSPSPNEVVTAAFTHAITTMFGTISLISLVSLVIRLPLIVFPRRITRILSIFTYSWISTPITVLTNPLTLTYAAIHSQSLQKSAQALSQMHFLTPQTQITTLTPRSFNVRNRQQIPLLPYRLAKLLLFGTRFIMAVSLSLSGWVFSAKKLKITSLEGDGIRGSAYSYVIGLIAGLIGWGVLGAVEGILSGIVDASLVCWGSEKGMSARGGSYCLEAGYLFGDARTRDLA
ncbi:Choline transporter-like protein ctl1 [Golovinomyces cichoracearum]|uniref:Protein PNS1 n=1 Tax=Golovinomyces cichoracearum TaxID=62708 RepID=A0A420HA28_9PEZI|nr:Choline transporter-like protein ctl1 [Golovinomyces cichoracearum]